ncbi:hypothetical protein ABZW58_29080 [Streptomyces cellulosae]
MQHPGPAQTVKDLVIAAGRAAARPVSWREGSRPGKGRSGVKRMHSRFVALRIRPAGRGVRRAVDGPELPSGGCWPTGRLPSRNRALLAVEPALRHAVGHPGAAGQTPLAHRTRLPRYENKPWAWPTSRAAPGPAGTTTCPSSPPHTPFAPCNDWPVPQKTQRRPEPLPSCPRAPDTHRHLGRRLPHLPPRHTQTTTNLTKPY